MIKKTNIANDNWSIQIKDYIDILLDVNKSIIYLVGSSTKSDKTNFKISFLKLTQDLLILFPLVSSNKKIKLNKKDGILNFKSDLDFLFKDYQGILKNNYEVFYNIKQIRDKFVHNPHLINYKSFETSNKDYPKLKVDIVNNNEYDFNMKDLVLIVMSLNIVFSKIVEQLKIYVQTNKIKLLTDPYYSFYAKIDFTKYNVLYNNNDFFFISDLLANK